MSEQRNSAQRRKSLLESGYYNFDLSSDEEDEGERHRRVPPLTLRSNIFGVEPPTPEADESWSAPPPPVPKSIRKCRYYYPFADMECGEAIEGNQGVYCRNCLKRVKEGYREALSRMEEGSQKRTFQPPLPGFRPTSVRGRNKLSLAEDWEDLSGMK